MHPRQCRLRRQAWPQISIAARDINPFEALCAWARLIKRDLARAHWAPAIVIHP